MLRASVIAVLLSLLVAAGGCGGDDTSTSVLANGEGGVYIALGDSFAAGTGASDPEATSYVALIANALQSIYGDGLETNNLAVGGATTQSLIDSQLAAAVDALKAGDARLVTVTIGGNDLNALGSNAVCQQDPADTTCPIDDILNTIEANLDSTIAKLQEASGGTPIAIELYPNLFSGTGHMYEQQAEKAFGMLNDVIEDVADRHDLVLADPREPFAGNGPELTHLADPTPDAHPNDDGHREIANAFLVALGVPAD